MDTTKQLREAIAAAVAGGTTINRLAMSAGLPHSLFTRVIRGEGVPRIDTCDRMLKAMGLAISFAKIEGTEDHGT